MKNVLIVFFFLVIMMTVPTDTFACISKISDTSVGIEHRQKDSFTSDSLPEFAPKLTLKDTIGQAKLQNDLKKEAKQKKQTVFAIVVLVLIVAFLYLKKMIDDFHLNF